MITFNGLIRITCDYIKRNLNVCSRTGIYTNVPSFVGWINYTIEHWNDPANKLLFHKSILRSFHKARPFYSANSLTTIVKRSSFKDQLHSSLVCEYSAGVPTFTGPALTSPNFDSNVKWRLKSPHWVDYLDYLPTDNQPDRQLFNCFCTKGCSSMTSRLFYQNCDHLMFSIFI